MARPNRFSARFLSTATRTLATAALVLGGLSGSTCYGQIGSFFPRVVGGVQVDAEGVARSVSPADLQQWSQNLRQQLKGAPADLQASDGLRYVSLKTLAAAVDQANTQASDVDEATMLLGGLTRIEYVLLYPESQDIVVAGPAEDWTTAADGTVVGKKSGQPILRLDDLIVAMRQLNTANPQSISISIDPTADGAARLQSLQSQIRLTAGQSPQHYEEAMREAFGPQKVTLNGVDADTHLAQVLFAADYEMKRIGMKLRASPVQQLPSYIDMLRRAAAPKGQSRWWLASDYQPVERSADGRAWRIQGVGLQVETEESLIQSDGSRINKGQADPLAEKWADKFTDVMDEMVVAEPAIGSLRTVMDLSVLAALIRTHNLEEAAGCDLSAFRRVELQDAEGMTAPSWVPPQCSFVRAGSQWIVTASGGVLIDPWAEVRDVVEVSTMTETLAAAEPTGKLFW